jgi:hypothetical protein
VQHELYRACGGALRALLSISVFEWCVRYLEDNHLIQWAVDVHGSFGGAVLDAEKEDSDFSKDDERKTTV